MIRYIAACMTMAAAAIAVLLSPLAHADTDPLVSYGTNPPIPAHEYHVSNHDEANTTNGFVDTAF